MSGRVLIAPEGKIYTNGEIYATKIWLGIDDSKYNWQEITLEEAEERQAVSLDPTI